MTKPNKGTIAEEHEEAPNEYLITRRATLLGVMGTILTPVSGLLSPALAQGTLKEAAEIGDVLKNIPGLCRVTSHDRRSLLHRQGNRPLGHPRGSAWHSVGS